MGSFGTAISCLSTKIESGPTMHWIGWHRQWVEGIRWDGIHILHAFDIDTELIPALIAAHGRDVAAKFCIGPVAGDLLRLDISTLVDVDMIISGLPCPP